MKRIWLVSVAAVLASGCITRCLLYCASLQTIILRDGAGNALAPLSVRDAAGTLHECPTDGGVPSNFVTCQTDRITFDQRSFATSQVVRVDALSGEVFEGDITPKFTGAQDADGCGCGDAKFEDRTVTLTAP